MIVNKYFNGGGGGSGERGPQGYQGPEGPQGPQGANGQDGLDGKDGADGKDGLDGQTGPQGVEGAQGPQGVEGQVGPQGPQGPAGGKQLPVECPDVQLLLDICDGDADVAVRLKDAAGNLLGKFSSSNDPHSIYFEGEYAGGLYQIEFEGEWGGENIHFIYDCEGIYESGVYNITKAFDKISIDLIYDEDSGEYNIEFNINYVGGEGGDGYILKSSSGTPENLGIGDGISKTEEETYEDYENHDVSEWDGPFCIENIDGMTSPDVIYFSTLSGLVINYEWDEWHEDTQQSTRRSSTATLSLTYDSANDSWNVDYNDPDGGLNMSQESGNYYFNGPMDFSFHVDPASEHDIPLRFDYSSNNNPCFEKGDCEGGYSIKVEKTRPKSNGMWIWKTNPEWGRWIGYRPNNGIGNSETDGVFLVYDYLPQEIDGQKIAKLSYQGGTYGNDKYLYIDLNEMRLKTHLSEDTSTLTEDIIDPNTETTVGNFGIGDMRIYWDTNNKFIRFRSDYNTVQEPISTTLEGEGLECLVKNDNYHFDFQDGVVDGMPKWDNNGKIVGRTYGMQTKQVCVNTTQWNNSMSILHNGDNNFPDRIWVPTTGGDSGQVLVSGGQDSAPTWESMIKAVKITSSDYEALIQAGTTDPNTLYLIDDNV